jgi:hypothetical protein
VVKVSGGIVKRGDLFRTRCEALRPLVEWHDETDWDDFGVTETLPPGVSVLFLRRGVGAWQRRLCVLVGGRVGWVWEDDLEPL